MNIKKIILEEINRVNNDDPKTWVGHIFSYAPKYNKKDWWLVDKISYTGKATIVRKNGDGQPIRKSTISIQKLLKSGEFEWYT